MAKFIEIDVQDVFARTFVNAEGNEDLCSPTGRQLSESDDPADWWNEFEDSLGGLHYGR